MSQEKVLVIDDDQYTRAFFDNLLKKNNYDVRVAYNGSQGLEMVAQEDFTLVLLDLKLPDMDGIEVLKKLRGIQNKMVVIIISAYGTLDYSIKAMRYGADDFFTKPFENTEKILLNIRNAISKFYLYQENIKLKQTLKRVDQHNRFIGQSKAARQIIEAVNKIAQVDSSVLIEGKSGTGKELIAKMIHEQSNRSEAPFLPLNCGALPETLQESILFGYEKGAFTGAYKTNRGYFEEVEGGTIFLDELGNAPMSLQAKLLRVLEERKLSRVGSMLGIKANFRLLCASNQDLMELTRKGSFRDDLYYRIAVIRIKIPCLRERKEDIVLLANHFIKKHCNYLSQPQKQFTRKALDTLKEHNWDGNVRELDNFIENLVIFHNGSVIDEDHISPWLNNIENIPINYMESKEHFERDYFLNILSKVNNNIQEAAKISGLDVSTVYRKVSKLNISIKTSSQDY